MQGRFSEISTVFGRLENHDRPLRAWQEVKFRVAGAEYMVNNHTPKSFDASATDQKVCNSRPCYASQSRQPKVLRLAAASDWRA